MPYSKHPVAHIDYDKLMSQAFAATGYGMAVVDFSKQVFPIVRVNKTFEKMTGYEAKELIGQPLSLVYAQMTDTRLRDLTDSVLCNGKSVARVSPGYTKSGNMIWSEVIFSPSAGEGDIPNSCMVVIVRDISHNARFEKYAEHERMMNVIGQLSGGIAHDFNNILMAVLGNLEMLEGFVENSPRHAQMLATATRAANRGRDLTQRLLVFSRRNLLSPQLANINDVIVDMQDKIALLMPESVTVTYKMVSAPWPCSVDVEQLQNAIANICMNARDAITQTGKILVKTKSLTLSKGFDSSHVRVNPGDYVMLAVHDSGQGIPPHLMQKIFEPFFTTKDTGKGVGLGLSVVHGFVTQSGGYLHVKSVKGKGTTMYMLFPRAYASDMTQAVQPQEAPRDTGAKDTSLRGLKMLVVEDNPDILDLMNLLLSGEGVDLATASDGKEALEVMKGGCFFDVLLTDVVMPNGMNGEEVARRAREICPKVRIMYMSGYTKEALHDNGTIREDIDLLRKPFSRDQLLSKLRQVAHKKQAG